MADKFSQIASGIKPYVISWVRDIIVHGGALGLGGSGGVVVSGAPSPHSLGGGHHTGELLDGQGPQFLLVDGTRSLTGDLAVGAGVTIDTVDISAHAANVAAHHSPASAGDGITVSGGQEVAVDTTVVRTTRTLTAGAGMTGGGTLAADRTFDVIAGNGIVVATDSVAVDLATNSGLTFDTAKLTLGTPSALAYNSADAVSGTAHSHSVTASSDVSAGVAALLKSDASGGLNLRTADVLETFYVGQQTTEIRYHSHDGVDHSHIIVNPGGDWTFDEQFDVDIYNNLLVRGYIVGNLTIQVKDMAPIMTFDGPTPYQTNYKGVSTGSGGQTAIVAVGNKAPIYIQGKFGKCVQVARSATNLCTNPSGETGTTGWSSNGSATITNDTLYSFYGQYSIKVVTTSGGTTGAIWGNFTMAATTAYSAGCWVKRTEVAADLKLSLREGSTTQIAQQTIPQVLGWQFVSVTGTTTTGGTGRIYVQKNSGGDTPTYYVDGVMIEQRAYITPPAIGDMGVEEGDDAHAWSGTAHASQSTRTDTGFYYPVNSPVNPRGGNGSVGIWFRAPWGTMAPTGSTHYFFAAGQSNLSCRVGVTGNITYRVGFAGDKTYTGFTWDNEWHLLFLTWDTDTNVKLYIDGVEVDSTTNLGEVTQANNVYVGLRDADQDWFDGWLDHLMFATRALDPEEILAIYTAEGPAFAYHATFFTRFGRNRFLMDSTGFWGIGASGRRLIGIYAGEDNNPSATYAWGGVTMSEGDILFGQKGSAGGGWAYFDQESGVGSQPQWSFGYTDAGSTDYTVLQLDRLGATLDGVLDISTTGGIFQGSGTFDSPTTGLKLFNSGGSGKISGYNTAVEQITLDTDGKLKAGAGAVVLDADGITIAGGTGSVNSIIWKTGGTTLTNIWTQESPAGRALMEINAGSLGSLHGYIQMTTRDDTGGTITGIDLDGQNKEVLLSVGSTQGLTLTTTLNTSHHPLATANVRAIDTAGLRLENDGAGLGIIILDSGDVGIGNATPDVPLHAKGNTTVLTIAPFKFENTMGANQNSSRHTLVLKATTTASSGTTFGPSLRFDINDAETSGDNGIALIGGYRDGADNNGQLRFSTALGGTRTDRMAIDSDGLVGVNQLAPSAAQFEVVSGANDRVSGIFNSGASPSADIFRVLRNAADRVSVDSSGWLKVIDQQTTTGPIFTLQSAKGTAAADFDVAGIIRARAKDGTGGDNVFADIVFQAMDVSSPDQTGGVFFVVQKDDADSYPMTMIGNNVGINKSTSLEDVSALYVRQPASSGFAQPVLTLEQTDLSEEMIDFVTTVGAGNPVNTTILGSYYGRVRVAVNGTFYYIPLHNA
jgi:hypothetical protein